MQNKDWIQIVVLEVVMRKSSCAGSWVKVVGCVEVKSNRLKTAAADGARMRPSKIRNGQIPVQR